MKDLSAAIAAAREALAKEAPTAAMDAVRLDSALRDLLAAIEAARGEAVAWQVTVVDNTGTHDYAKWAGLQAPPAAAVPSGWEIRRSVNHEGEICVVAPNCDPGAARISYGGRLENRLLYRLAEAMLAAERKGEES